MKLASKPDVLFEHWASGAVGWVAKRVAAWGRSGAAGLAGNPRAASGVHAQAHGPIDGKAAAGRQQQMRVLIRNAVLLVLLVLVLSGVLIAKLSGLRRRSVERRARAALGVEGLDDVGGGPLSESSAGEAAAAGARAERERFLEERVREESEERGLETLNERGEVESEKKRGEVESEKKEAEREREEGSSRGSTAGDGGGDGKEKSLAEKKERAGGAREREGKGKGGGGEGGDGEGDSDEKGQRVALFWNSPSEEEEGVGLDERARRKRFKTRSKKCRDVPERAISSDFEMSSKSFPPPLPRDNTTLRTLSYVSISRDEVQAATAGAAEVAAGSDTAESTSPWRKGRSASLGMFWGAQTMAERKTSFEIQPKKAVHCGFAAKGVTGFDVSDGDEQFMATCEVVVATCIFGGGDLLRQPEEVYSSTMKKVCFVAFWDEGTLAVFTQSNKNRLDMKRWNGRIGVWRIVMVSNLPFVDQRLNGKIPKMLSHRLFPLARYSIWVDAKLILRRDPLAILESVLWRENKTMAMTQHWKRSCVYEEALRNIELEKDSPKEIKRQMDFYEKEGLPENATFNGHPALAEASFILREHTPLTNLFMCNWFNECMHFTSRDQLSFGHMLRRLGDLKPYMFHLCDRMSFVKERQHQTSVDNLKTLEGGKDQSSA